MSNYQYRIFVDREGRQDYIRKQDSSKTELAEAITATQVVIPVVSISDLFGGDLGDVVTRTYTKNFKISTDEITVTADGAGTVFLLPDYWTGNTVTITANATPLTEGTDYTVELNRVRFTATPAQGVTLVFSTTIQSLTLPELGAEPTVVLNDVELVLDTDYTVTSLTTTSVIEFDSALAVNDNVNISVEYSRSGAETVWIDNEQITFQGIDLNNNLLLQCQRGVNTTTPRAHAESATVWDGSDRQSLLTEAAKPDSLFTESDVESYPWKTQIIDFLSSQEINT